jgi:hypothetical protein
MDTAGPLAWRGAGEVKEGQFVQTFKEGEDNASCLW